LFLSRTPTSTPFPYTTLFRSDQVVLGHVVLDQGSAVEHGKAVAQAAQGVVHAGHVVGTVGVKGLVSAGGLVVDLDVLDAGRAGGDRKSTRLNSSHVSISYAVF